MPSSRPASTVPLSDRTSSGASTSAAASASSCATAAASWRTAPSGESAPLPLPVSEPIASTPTKSEAATPPAATSDPIRRCRRPVDAGSKLVNETTGGTSSSTAASRSTLVSARRHRRPGGARRPTPRRRRGRSPAAPASRIDRAGHSLLASASSSDRKRRRARISTTRALAPDMPTASAATAIGCRSTSTMYSSARTFCGSRMRSSRSLG